MNKQLGPCIHDLFLNIPGNIGKTQDMCVNRDLFCMEKDRLEYEIRGYLHWFLGNCLSGVISYELEKLYRR